MTGRPLSLPDGRNGNQVSWQELSPHQTANCLDDESPNDEKDGLDLTRAYYEDIHQNPSIWIHSVVRLVAGRLPLRSMRLTLMAATVDQVDTSKNRYLFLCSRTRQRDKNDPWILAACCWAMPSQSVNPVLKTVLLPCFCYSPFAYIRFVSHPGFFNSEHRHHNKCATHTLLKRGNTRSTHCLRRRWVERICLASIWSHGKKPQTDLPRIFQNLLLRLHFQQKSIANQTK